MSATSAVKGSSSAHLSNLRLMIATTLGSIFEIYDFIAFVFVSPILAQVFFPPSAQHSSLWLTYLTIAISYVLRPIGGIILGHLGDRYGRKSVFTLSILLMALPSLAIALLPTYAHIGYVATTLLLLLRILQGFSLGGEVPGSITYIAEQFKQRNYYFACAWLTFGANLAVASCSWSIRFLSHASSTQFMHSFGWRIPFLFGSLLTVIGFYIRQHISESKAYRQIQHHKQINNLPIADLLKQHRGAIVGGIGLALIVSLTTSVFHVFLPNLLITYLNLSLTDTTTASTAGALSLAIGSLIAGFMSRGIAPLLQIRLGLIGLCLIFAGISWQLIRFDTPRHLISWIVIISLLLATINGNFFALLADLFPTQVRYSGIAICYNIAYILGAGITPLWASAILATTHSYAPIAGICLVVGIMALANIRLVAKVLPIKA